MLALLAWLPRSPALCLRLSLPLPFLVVLPSLLSCGSALDAFRRNFDGDSVFMYFQHYGGFLFMMTKCVQFCAGTLHGVMTLFGLPCLVALCGLMVFIAMMGCSRSVMSSFKAEMNGCSSWAFGGGRCAGDELLAVLVRGWAAAGALIQGFRMLVLQAAAAQAAALCFFGFHALHEASAASMSSVRSDSMQRLHQQPRCLARVLRFCWGRKSPSFFGFSSDYRYFLSGFSLEQLECWSS